MKISVVIPNHNRADALALTLEALAKQTYPAEQFEVIVVDQASTDGSRELVSGYDAPYLLRLVTQDAKYGISIARNAGFAVAVSPFVLLLDADLLPESGLVSAHVDALRKDPDSLVCGRILPYPPIYHTFVERAANPDAGLDQGDQAKEIPYYQAFGGHLSLSLVTYQKIGAFDPDLKGFEDLEFAYRASKEGIFIHYCPEARAYHNHPRTLKERCLQVRTYYRMLPIIYQIFPQWRNNNPYLRPYESIDWFNEPITQILKKLSIRFYSILPIRWALYSSCHLMNQFPISTRLARFLYYRLIFANSYIGVEEGRLQGERGLWD